MKRRRWLDALLMVGVLALIAIALIVGAKKEVAEAEEPFGGTDAAVTEQIESDGYEPWFEPIFAPGSGEVESGLFAAQAALGAGALGYCLGAMRRRGRDTDRPETGSRMVVADGGDLHGDPGQTSSPSMPSTPPGR